MLARYIGAQRLTMLAQQISQPSSTAVSNQIECTHYPNFLKVQLNRPSALNALNLSMVIELRQQLKTSISKTKAFWIEGAGGKAFCAGGDVKALFVGGGKYQTQIEFFREQFTMDYEISASKSLQISCWDGIVMGGGWGVSGFAKFRIATQNTIFAMPEAKIGFFTDVGSRSAMSRLEGNVGYYLAMTGAQLRGADVYRAGVANYFIPRANLAAAFQQVQSFLAVAQDGKIEPKIHEILKKHHKSSEGEAYELRQEIRGLFKGSLSEIHQNLCNSKSKFGVATKSLIEAQNPLSVAVIHRLLEKTHKQNVKQIFIEDFVVCDNFLRGNDFGEGVRCALIDKGSVPKWSFKSIVDVKPEHVEAMLSPRKDLKPLEL